MTEAMSDWSWTYEGYDPSEERLREALCTLGNGYFATRGAAPESAPGPLHYPGTYAAGCYNRLLSSVAGRDVENEDMVNLPNWLPLRFRIRTEEVPRGEWFSPDRDPAGLLLYRQTLDLRRGVLTRTLRVRDRHGRHLSVEQGRLVHMGDPHLAALWTVFTAEDFTGVIEIESELDGTVSNDGVTRYRDLNGHHLVRPETGAVEPGTEDDHSGAGVVWLRCHTSQSDISVALAQRTRAIGPELYADPDGEPPARLLGDRHALQTLSLQVAPGRPAGVEKTVALHTSRDPAVSSPLRAVLDRLALAPDLPELITSQAEVWARLWRQASMDEPGEPGRILRLHLFHVLQTLSPHTAELDVGVPARGLHGEAYRGHVFWDELFVLPYLNLHFPEVSRALLLYRHRRLPRAIRSARAIGRTGAMYPWQSGSDGREESQTLHLNPRSGHWVPDHSHLQRHVGSAVAYNVWRYGQATGDHEFLHTKGAEMILQIARFWADSAEWHAGEERYRLRGVMGPDEYHDAYPDTPEPGLDDNAFTNVTATWVLCRALELWRALPAPRRRQLRDRTGLDGGELELWEEVSRKLRVPFHAGVVSQFEGYGDLLELDWTAYRERYGDIRRLDRILEAEDDSVNRYQASKQADALMLGYLFSPRELAGIFARLGYRLDDDTWRRTVDYYLARTSHGSTLSGLVHGWVLARARHSDAWRYCQEALLSDAADIQGGTTEEGVHLGAMAGTLDLLQRGLTGLETHDGALWLDPAPLPELSEFDFSMRYLGHWGVEVRIKPGQLWIGVPPSDEPPIRVMLAGRVHEVTPGTDLLLPLG